MSFNGTKLQKIALFILFLIVIAIGIFGGIFNFFDKGVTIDTLKTRVGILGIGLVVAAIAGIISLKDFKS
ncbi:MAG: hypothetical protein ACFFD4_08720 [Candidatus Odinarchaeota archaeon]